MIVEKEVRREVVGGYYMRNKKFNDNNMDQAEGPQGNEITIHI